MVLRARTAYIILLIHLGLQDVSCQTYSAILQINPAVNQPPGAGGYAQIRLGPTEGSYNLTLFNVDPINQAHFHHDNPKGDQWSQIGVLVDLYNSRLKGISGNYTLTNTFTAKDLGPPFDKKNPGSFDALRQMFEKRQVWVGVHKVGIATSALRGYIDPSPDGGI